MAVTSMPSVGATASVPRIEAKAPDPLFSLILDKGGNRSFWQNGRWWTPSFKESFGKQCVITCLCSERLTSSQSNSSSRRGNSIDDDADLTTRDETLFENPQFEHYEETSNIQLFFDLFFVANLSSFTSAHEINSGHSQSLTS